MRELTMAARRENIPLIIDAVNEELDQLGCRMRTKLQIDIAIDELCSNVAKYAYGGERGHVTVQIEPEAAPRAMSISFIDSGNPFNPLEQEDPDVTLSAAQRRIGGLGILLVKKSMDEVCYAYRDGKNILTIRKVL